LLGKLNFVYNYNKYNLSNPRPLLSKSPINNF
jgi:hypothetical protein